ncbi:unnamed protein product, partial [Polarella glacialis]
ADAPLVAPIKASSGTGRASAPRRLTLLEQAFVCSACSSRSSRRQLVSTPTPRSGSRRSSSAGGANECVDGIISPAVEPSLLEDKASQEDALSSALAKLLGPIDGSPDNSFVGVAVGRALEINPDVLCPTHTGQLQVFDDYEFLAAIGSGAFGRVLRARHRAGGQLRACKALTTSGPLESELVATEIAVLKALNHPHILRLHEVYFEPSNSDRRRKVYLITDLCTGGDLLFRIAYHYQTLRAPMTEGHVGFMLRQLLSAAMYCHHRGIVHRDIKPDNVLFVDATASSPLKLIDFGLAGFAEQLREAAVEVSVPRSGSLGRLAKILPRAGARWCTVRKQMMQRAGTAYYMAPEMIQASVYDQKADMFSIGTILCEMLTGWHPFYTPQVDDAQSVQAKITSAKPVRLPDEQFGSLSAEARDLCQRLLEKDPKRRLSSGQALAHPWFRNPAMPSPYGNTNTGVLNAWVFEGLRQYQAHNKLRRAALQLLALSELAEEQVQEFRDAFMALDAQGDGLLSPEELAEGAHRAEVPLCNGEAALLIATLGGASGQRAGYKEFIAALAGRQVEYSSAQFRSCFKKLGGDSRGRLGLRQVLPVLCSSRSSSERPAITDQEWEEIVNSWSPESTDERSSEPTLGFEEFVVMMQAPVGPATQKVADAPLPVVPALFVRGAEAVATSGGDELSTGRLWGRCAEPLCC